MDIIDSFKKNVRGKNFSVVLPEGNDERIIQAARIVKDQEIARPIVLGKAEKIAEAVEKAGISFDGIESLIHIGGNISLIDNNFLKNIGEKEKYLDIIFNNAGIGSKCSITNKGTFEEYRKIMSVNVDGMWLVLQAALPYIGRPSPTRKTPDRREGQLIFSSSAAGKTGVPNMAAYAMSKSAIITLADSIRSEYKMNGHKIDVITSLSAPANTKFYSTPEMVNWVKGYKKRGFLFKFVEPQDVAKRVLKASRKSKKEVYVPRFWWLIGFLFVFSHGLIGNLLIKIEKTQE